MKRYNSVIIVVLLIVVILLLFKNCGGNIKPIDNSLIESKQKQIESLKSIIKSKEIVAEVLTKKKNKVVTEYKEKSKKVREQLKDSICDPITIIETLNECDSVINIDNQIISAKDSIIKDLKEVITNQEIIISEKDNTIKQVEKKYKRKLFWSRVETVCVSIIAVVATTLSIKQ